MRIKAVRAVEINPAAGKKLSHDPYQRDERQPATPMARYPAYKGRRSAWTPPWRNAACVVEADDGTFGLGMTRYAGPVLSIINDHFRPHLVGENCLATEKLFDLMVRLAAPYGAQGLPSYAISAVDLALWDLKGKLLQRPVYELLGGPQKERIFCYVTGFEVESYLEQGFRAIKLPLLFGPVDGIEGLHKAEDAVAAARELVGDDVELMLDCWMALDVEYTVRLAEVLKPYRLRWIEDYLPPEDMAGFAEVRRRLPGQGLATGEHWYLPPSFAAAAEQRVVDIFQPDVLWAGGISACVRICHIAEAAGLSVIPHAGMSYPYGQHLTFAMPAIPWGERSSRIAQSGVPLAQVVALPGAAVIEDGYLVPSDAPGFGIDVDMKWLEQVAV